VVFLLLNILRIPSSVQAMANPASVYCTEQGYRLEIRTSKDGSQFGLCIFPNGKECDEWKFYQGECGGNYKKNPLKMVTIGVSFLLMIGFIGIIGKIIRRFTKK